MSREQEVSGQPDTLEEQKASARKAMLEKMDLREVYELFKLHSEGESDISADKIKETDKYYIESKVDSWSAGQSKTLEDIRADKEIEIINHFKVGDRISLKPKYSSYDSKIGYLIKEEIIDFLLKSAGEKLIQQIQQTAGDLYTEREGIMSLRSSKAYDSEDRIVYDVTPYSYTDTALGLRQISIQIKKEEKEKRDAEKKIEEYTKECEKAKEQRKGRMDHESIELDNKISDLENYIRHNKRVVLESSEKIEKLKEKVKQIAPESSYEIEDSSKEKYLKSLKEKYKVAEKVRKVLQRGTLESEVSIDQDREVSSQSPIALEKGQKQRTKEAMFKYMTLGEIHRLSKCFCETATPDLEKFKKEELKQITGSNNDAYNRDQDAEDRRLIARVENYNTTAAYQHGDIIANKLKKYIIDSVILKLSSDDESLKKYEELAKSLYNAKHVLTRPMEPDITIDDLKIDEALVDKMKKKLYDDKFVVSLKTSKEGEKKVVKLSLKQLDKLHAALERRGESKYKEKSDYEIAKDITRSRINKIARSFAKNVVKMGSNVRKNVVSAVGRVLNRKKGQGVGGPGGGL